MARAPRKTADNAATRRQRTGDREGVDTIEHLPKSFAFMERSQNTRQLREVAAVVEALKARPGQDARVKRLQKRQNAEEFAETLRQYVTEHSLPVDVDLRGNEVFARYDDAQPLPPLPGDPTPAPGEDGGEPVEGA
jgi:hypothetical protein